MLNQHDPAPDFTVPDQDGAPVSLADFKGRSNVVLYFYPKDDTPGCTIEAKQFTELADAFGLAHTSVIGVSRDTCESHQAFISKFGLKVRLLADTEGQLCARYGVLQEKEKNGERKIGIVRSTFLIDKEGNLADVQYGVTAEGHAQEMLEKAKRL